MIPDAFRTILRAFLRGWPTMMGIHVAVAAVTAVLLAPLLALLVQSVVGLSGQSALSDVAIVSFLLSPAGVIAGVVVAAFVIAMQLLGYTAQLIPARRLLAGGEACLTEVIPVLLPAFPRVVRVCGRIVALLMIVSVPFFILWWCIHRILLGEQDINYYLAEQPPVWWLAVGLAAVVFVALVWSLARVATSWVHALPLVVFRGASPSEALRLSRSASRGQEKSITGGLLFWGLATPIVAGVLEAPWSRLALAVAHHPPDSVGWLVAMLAGCLTLSMLTGWIVGAAGFALLALHQFRLYQLAGLELTPTPLIKPPLPITGGWKALVMAAAAIGLITIWICHRWVERLEHEHSAVVIAHRGASLMAPENTMAAIRGALDARADWIEIDVQESADGVVMVFHDRDFKRLGGDPREISNLTVADIAGIDIGSWKSPAFSAERAPRLADVLELCRGRAGVLIELKYHGRQQRLEQRVVEVVEAAGMAQQVMVMSLDFAGVQKFRQLRPQWPIGMLSTVALGDVTRLEVDFLGLNARRIPRRLLRDAARRGVSVHAWTVNDPVAMGALLSLGVDGLITDDPASARRVIEERAKATFPERLMLHLAGFLGRPPVNVDQ